ncbi:MAG: hypothetical protein U0744_08220 [Gemmataceae bacterium]
MNVDGLPRLAWFASWFSGMATPERVTKGFFLAYVGGLSMMPCRVVHTDRGHFGVVYASGAVHDGAGGGLWRGRLRPLSLSSTACGMPLGSYWSLDVKTGRASAEQAVGEARIGLRVWQIHLCVVYLSSANRKNHQLLPAVSGSQGS